MKSSTFPSLKAEAMGEAIHIVSEMQAVLDKEKGGTIAANLDELYAYMVKHLTLANYDNDRNKIEEMIRLLEELREGWRAIAKPALSHAESR